MTIKDFLNKTINQELDLSSQKKYLEESPFGSCGDNELADAVKFLYSKMEASPELPDAIDLCGTGGSGLNRINTSTISAFIVAGAGVKVAKHGNNASSGRFGSFDLLQALDIPINLSNEELKLRYREYNLALLYAKNFHPIMRYFAPVRQELKKPTFFNILGPLLSPVKAANQLIGAPNTDYALMIINAAKKLNKQHVMVAVGSDGLDDITLSGSTKIFELKDNKISKYEINPEDFGIKKASGFSEIASQSNEENLKIFKDVIIKKQSGPKTDLVLINAAAAIYLAGKAKNLADGYKKALQSLTAGKAEEVYLNYKTPSFLKFIIENNKTRKFNLEFNTDKTPIKYRGGLIAEIKKSSPSEGEINRDIDVAKLAKIYQKSKASAISVLCEPAKFGGSFTDLNIVVRNVKIPVLCKDFILSKEHIDQALIAGADMILLIVALLSKEQLKELYEYAKTKNLQSLIEIHNENELNSALELKPDIIGVNSRNLHDFSINNKIFDDLVEKIPAGIIKIAESGISKYSDIPKDYDGILVGTEIMRHPFPELKIKELSGKPILKLCGIRSVDQAKLCDDLGIDMIGINFVPRSKRQVSIETAKAIADNCNNTITVGVFENQAPDEVNEIAVKVGLRAIQLSGQETDLGQYKLPVIKSITIDEKKPKNAFMTIIDNKFGGSGQKINFSELSKYEPSLIAGGIDIKTAKHLLSDIQPLGIDTASGIEENGEVSENKIKQFSELLKSTSYTELN